jgi:flagellar protein FlaF
VTEPESQLPLPVRQNIANLGIFVLSQTAELQVEPKPEKLDILVKINREVAAGLRGEVA